MNVLVAGGAGYIGSHTVQELQRRGYRVVVVDNLVSGHRSAVRCDLMVADVSDRQTIAAVARDYRIDAVIHFAAFAAVGESMENPGKYFANNVVATQALLDALVGAGVTRFIFSSSCAVYGQPNRLPVTEDTPACPESPYGESKLIVERMLRWYDYAHGLKFISLRYFNAAGTAVDGSIGEDIRPAIRIIPVALEVAMDKRPQFTLNGTDYDTPDGTCIRDYVHVQDLATAHVRALEYLTTESRSDIFNLGIGRGYSNRQILDVVQRVTGASLNIVQSPRREGDPACVYADSTRVRRVLGWEPRHSDIETMVSSNWNWRQAHPNGYLD
ncbi:MAG: UDP-glucose 4-epimerase GalE [Chloroflexota bacterium]|nr:MAG: UDP-glucose 4-epimerase GalE [Chloroflexota bacterium]